MLPYIFLITRTPLKLFHKTSCCLEVRIASLFFIKFICCFLLYSSRDPHPIFRTSNMTYGSKPPNVHTIQTTFQPRSQKFSTHLAACGMYRNHSLNTDMEKSIANGADNAALTRLDRLNFHKSYSANPNV